MDITDPSTAWSAAAKSSLAVADDVAAKLHNPDWLELRAGLHASNTPVKGAPPSPFVSVGTNVESMVNSTDDTLRTIATGRPGVEGYARAPFIVTFEVSASLLHAPINALSKSETELLFFGTDLLRYVVSARPNPHH